jgi:hypothetical protein
MGGFAREVVVTRSGSEMCDQTLYAMPLLKSLYPSPYRYPKLTLLLYINYCVHWNHNMFVRTCNVILHTTYQPCTKEHQ